MYIKFDEDWPILQGIVNCIKIVCILNYNMKYHYGNTKYKGQKIIEMRIHLFESTFKVVPW